MSEFYIKDSCREMVAERPFEIWRHENLTCIILRMPHAMHLCGYVGVPKDHILYKKDYQDNVDLLNPDEIKLNSDNILGMLSFALEQDRKLNAAPIEMILHVHGGITFSDHMFPHYFGEDLWFFGFDCAHFKDITPICHTKLDISEFNSEATYKNMKYVKKETQKLAEQIALIKDIVKLPT